MFLNVALTLSDEFSGSGSEEVSTDEFSGSGSEEVSTGRHWTDYKHTSTRGLCSYCQNPGPVWRSETYIINLSLATLALQSAGFSILERKYAYVCKLSTLVNKCFMDILKTQKGKRYLESQLNEARQRYQSLQNEAIVLLKNTIPSNLRSCPANWRSYKNAVYKFFNTAKTWKDAEATCNSFGSAVHLVSIQSSAEAARVSHFLPSTTKDIWTGGFRAPGGQRPWNGMWTWTDGSAFKYTNWRPGEPNHNLGVEYYIQISDVGGKNDWNDFPDRNHLPFVCKCRLQ